MKKHFICIFCLFLLVLAAKPAICADMDPILLNKPSSIVVGCNNDYFMQIKGQAVITATLGKHSARSGELYLFILADVLYLSADFWDDGIDTSSFIITNTTAGDWIGSLNTAVTQDELVQKDYDLLSDPLACPSYKTYRLVFTIPSTMTDKNHWVLHFSPTQYFKSTEVDDWDFDADVSSGAYADPMCTMELSFTVQ